MAELFKRDGVYHARMYYYDPDKDARVGVKRSTGIKTDGSRDAEKRARIVAAEMEKALVTPEVRNASKKTVLDALDAREQSLRIRKAPESSWVIYRAARKHLLAALGGKTLCRRVSDKSLRDFADKLLQAGMATDTVRRYIVELTHSFRLAGERVPAKPELGPQRFRDEYLTWNEVERICDWLPSDKARVVKLVWQTACRRREVYKLQWVSPGWARLVGKTGLKTGERTIPLTPLAEKLLKEGPLKPWSNAWLGLTNAAKKAGVKGANWNALRAGAATALLEAGVSVAHTSAFLGHVDTTMVSKRYAKTKNLRVTQEHVRVLPGATDED